MIANNLHSKMWFLLPYMFHPYMFHHVVFIITLPGSIPVSLLCSYIERLVSSIYRESKIKDERDFGLETETETRVVSRPVSSFETTCQKSQCQSNQTQPNLINLTQPNLTNLA